jgi:hypothetical protein
MKKLISIGELIDQTWEFYKENFSDLMGISAWLLVTALAGVIGWALFPDINTLSRMAEMPANTQLTNWQTFGIGMVLLNRFIIFPVASIWVFSSIAEFVNKRLNKSRPRIKHALIHGWKHFFPVLLSRVIYSLLIFVGMLIGIGPVLLLLLFGVPFEGTNAIVLSILGIVGLVISVFLMVRWAIMYYLGGFGYTNVIEQKHGLRSMKRSNQLTKGRFWSSLLRIVIPKILFIGIATVVVYLTEPLVSVFQGAFLQGISSSAQIRLQTVFVFVWPTIFMVFINPLVYIADVLIYRNLRDTVNEADQSTNIPKEGSTALNG